MSISSPTIQSTQMDRPHFEDDEIDLRVYLQILNKYKWPIFRLTLLIGIFAALVSFLLTPIYQASALFLIEQEAAKIISIEEVYGLGAGKREYLETQLEILKSRSLAEKVVDKLDLISHPLYSPTLSDSQDTTIKLNWREWIPPDWLPTQQVPHPLSEAEIRNAVVNTFMSHLDIKLLRNTQLVSIRFESPDPKLAASVPNVLAELYIENDLEARLEMTHQATGWLTERLQGLRSKLEHSEQELQAYLEKQNLLDVGDVKSLVTGRLEEMGRDMVATRSELAQIESVYAQVQRLKGRPASAYESLPEVLNNPLVQRLKEAELDAESKVSELSKRYGPKHPSMIAANTELQTAKENTAKQILQVISGIEQKYRIAKSNADAIAHRVRQTEGEIQDISRKQYQLNVLKREVETNRNLYDMFLSRFKETDISASQNSTIGRIVDPAVLPSSPAKPKKSLIVAIALVLGVLFSTMLAFLLEHLDNTLKTAEDVENKLNLPVLGVLPKISALKQKSGDKVSWMFLTGENSPFIENIRTIRTGIMLSGVDNSHKTIMVTSALPGEGKTTLAINQAFALGQIKKTLLIDADMRRPSIQRIFGLSHHAPGLSALTAGSGDIETCIYPFEDAGVDLLPTGVIPPNPLELLASKHFKDLITELEQRYEQIVIDTPPVTLVSDALVLSTYASAVIFVIKADQTPYQIALEGIKSLQQAKAPLLGAVLNGWKVKSQKYGKYSYYGKSYYGYYGTRNT